MRHPTNASLLLLLTSAIAACGGTAEPLIAVADAGAEAGTDASFSRDAATEAAAPADAADSGDAGCGQPDGDGGCLPPSIRRPFLVGSSLRSAVAVPRGDWLAAPLSPVAIDHGPTANKLAATWLKDALEEHASVAAFARFTMHLLALGAPPDLVAAAQRASLDEIRHAKMCFALARRYGSPVQGPGALSLRDALGEVSLADVAALAAEEGCVGETLGAALAREQLAVVRDPDAARVLETIARDEARHAELAWRFVRWAVLQGGDEARRVVEERVEAAIRATLAMEIQSYDGVDLDVWHAHGRLTCAEACAVAELAIREVVRPCVDAALAPASEPPAHAFVGGKTLS